MKNYVYVNGQRVLVSVEAETYTMENGLGETVTIVEDYGNDKSYVFFCGQVSMFEDATRAANVAFKRGFRE